MGLPDQRFVDHHKEKVNEIKRHLMDYVKSLRPLINTDVHGRPAENVGENTNVKITDEGYPILPSTPLTNLNKCQLTKLLRSYLGAHYSKYDFHKRIIKG
jgi:hypothetical protein